MIFNVMNVFTSLSGASNQIKIVINIFIIMEVVKLNICICTKHIGSIGLLLMYKTPTNFMTSSEAPTAYIRAVHPKLCVYT